MSADPQLAMDVDLPCLVDVDEQRGGERRAITLGPLAEPQAQSLVALLLNRTDVPAEPGPWRLAMAGGTRTVSLRSAE